MKTNFICYVLFAAVIVRFTVVLVRSYSNDVTLFFFDVTCNSTRLSWSAVEELFDSMSSEEFHRMLPLKLSEDSDCVPGTRAFSSVCFCAATLSLQ